MKFEKARAPLVVGLVSAMGLGLGGCMSSPTYGTGKTANEQLVEDLTGILSFRPKQKNDIDYNPRPDLVRPQTTAVLPPPQDSVTTASNSAWPEAPEKRLARIRADATENRDNPTFRPAVDPDMTTETAAAQPTEGQDADQFALMRHRNHLATQRGEIKQRVAENNGAIARRKYLSEPPLDYRAPAATAPAGELGTDEWQKERDAKRAARAGSSGKKKSWWPF